MEPDYLKSVFILAGAATTFVKILDALLRMMFPSASARIWAALSLPEGMGIVALLMIIGGQTSITLPVVAQVVLAGLLSAGIALGIIAQLDKQVQKAQAQRATRLQDLTYSYKVTALDAEGNLVEGDWKTKGNP